MVCFKGFLIFLGASIFFVNCGRPSGVAFQSLKGNQEALETSHVIRKTIATMTFTKWGDVIMADAGVEKRSDGSCDFVMPYRNDGSTLWSPFQIYWLIFDKPDDVKNGQQLEGFFGYDDLLSSNELIRRDGNRPHGFAYLSPEGSRMVNLSPGKFVDQGTQLQTVLNISGRKAAIRSFAENQDDVCTVRTEGCVGGEECFLGGVFLPLGNLAVSQTFLGFPKEVTQEPLAAIIRTK